MLAKEKIGKASAVAQWFVWELHDDTLFPAKYYKEVCYYLFDVLEGKKSIEDKDIPKAIHYSYAVKEYAKFNQREIG